MSTRTAMTTENRDQREANAKPNSAGNTGGGAVLGATPCSPKRVPLSGKKLGKRKICPFIFTIENDGTITESPNPDFKENAKDQSSPSDWLHPTVGIDSIR